MAVAEKDEMRACQPYAGRIGNAGYGESDYAREHLGVHGAHRFAWISAFGPIQDGLHVCHRCDNPACVNTEHLFLGTASDNARDMVSKGRWSNGRSTKITVEQAAAIRTDLNSRTIRDVATAYGLGATQVWRIKHGIAWSGLGTTPPKLIG